MRLFTKNHLWIDVEGNKAKIGITYLGQEFLGELIFINLPKIGDILHIDTKFADVEGVKKVTDLLSMVNGAVLSINEKLLEEPSIINSNADNEWLVEVEVDQIKEGLTEIEP